MADHPSSDHPLLERIRAFVTPLSKGSPRPRALLVAMSGGLDSTVLLDLLRRLCPLQDMELAIAHIDHGMRACSRQDAFFCRQIAASHGLYCHVETLHIPEGHSTQNRARNARYAALAAIAGRLDIRDIVTAHHADDAVETALLNFSRGTGLPGLVSLTGQGPFPLDGSNLRIFRPLLSSSRAELEDYATTRRLAFRQDPSNLKDDYERNRLRHHVIPALVETHTTAALSVTLENLRSEAAALEAYADELLERAWRDEAGLQTIVLDRRALKAAPRATTALLLRRLHRGWTQSTLSRALDIIASDAITARQTISGALLTIASERILIEPVHGRGAADLDDRVAYPARIPITESLASGEQSGALPFFDGVLSWNIRGPLVGDQLPQGPLQACFDLQRMQEQTRGTLQLRGPRRGEKMSIPGMKGRKKISDLLQENRIDPDLRWRWPCLTVLTRGENTEELLWVVGLRRAAHFPITPDTRPILEIRWSPLPSIQSD